MIKIQKTKDDSHRSFVKHLLMISKLMTFLLLVNLSTVSAGSFAQTVTLRANNITLLNAMRTIKKQTGHPFFLKGKELAEIRRNVDINQMPLKEALNKLLTDLPAKWIIEEGTIVIKSVPFRTLREIKNNEEKEVAASYQDKIVTGKVSDENGNGLEGVSVTVKGTNVGTTSDASGEFSLRVRDDAQSLIFSMVGYGSTEREIKEDAINVILHRQEGGLDEVVVIGYGSQRKSDITGSIASVNAEQIEKIPITSVDQAMQGRAAGVQITTNDGSPGSMVSVKIRGTGTFGDNSPLYVIDGYPYSGGDISSLNPADIESISILKDASATAIYGNRASNGVVIITTKRGTAGKLKLSLNGSLTAQAKPKKYDVMNAEQFLDVAKYVNTTYGYPIESAWLNNDDSQFTNIDWQDVFYRTGLQQNYGIALRGGTEKLKSSFSLGYFDRKGNIIFSNYKRYNTSIDLDYTPNKWLRGSANVKYAYSQRDVRYGTGVNGLANLTQQIPLMNGNPVTGEVVNKDGVFGYYSIGPQATVGMTNIYANIAEQDVGNPQGQLLTSGAIEITPVNGLKLKSNFGINIRDNSSFQFSPSNERTVPAPPATLTRSSSNTTEWLWENTVNYTKSFGIHFIDFVGGISAQENTNRQLSASGNTLISNELRDVSSLQLGLSATGFQQSWSIASQFGRLTYRLLDRYILTGTVRRDGSSRFGDGHKWGVFPSVSAAWIISDESFLASSKSVTNLKLRGSWGQAGNQNIALFQYLGTYTAGPSQNNNRGYNFGPGDSKVFYPGLVLTGVPDPSLTWETAEQTDIGLDASFLNGRISLTADYYSRKSKNFLLNIPVPSQSGFSSATRNVGSIQNDGLELTLSYNSNTGGAFKWDISGNVTFLKNKILSFTQGLTSMGNFSTLSFRNYGGNVWAVYSMSEIGGPVGAFYGFKSAGIFQNKDEIDNLNQKATANFGLGTFYQSSTTSPGDYHFVDINGDGRITDADRTIIGSPIPKLFGGLTWNGSYKEWDFSVYFYGVAGNDVLNYMKSRLQNLDKADGVGLQNFSTEFYNNHWTEENHSTIYPRIVSYDANGNNRVSDVFVEKGDYLRLKNLQVGYTFKHSLVPFSERFRVYVGVQNLFTITGYSGLDPEIGDAETGNVTSTGVDVGNYPSSRFYNLGINITF